MSSRAQTRFEVKLPDNSDRSKKIRVFAAGIGTNYPRFDSPGKQPRSLILTPICEVELRARDLLGMEQLEGKSEPKPEPGSGGTTQGNPTDRSEMFRCIGMPVAFDQRATYNACAAGDNCKKGLVWIDAEKTFWCPKCGNKSVNYKPRFSSRVSLMDHSGTMLASVMDDYVGHKIYGKTAQELYNVRNAGDPEKGEAYLKEYLESRIYREYYFEIQARVGYWGGQWGINFVILRCDTPGDNYNKSSKILLQNILRYGLDPSTDGKNNSQGSGGENVPSTRAESKANSGRSKDKSFNSKKE